MVNSSKNTTVQLHNIKRVLIKNVEGKRILLPAKGHLQDTLTEMEQDLQSAISYAGGSQVADLKHVDYVIVKNSIWNGGCFPLRRAIRLEKNLLLEQISVIIRQVSTLSVMDIT